MAFGMRLVLLGWVAAATLGACAPAMGQMLRGAGGSSAPSLRPILDESSLTELRRYLGPEAMAPPQAEAVRPAPHASLEPGPEAICSECGEPFGEYADCGDPFGGPLLGRPHGPRPSLWASIHNCLHGYRYLGHPLQRESWLYRPFSAGWFMGMVQGGPLIDDWLGQQRGYFAGYRFGWDQDHFWGGEMRFAFGSIELYDTARAIQAQIDADTERGWALDDPRRDRFDRRRDTDYFQWDVSVLYYPWGDTGWRPYALIGVGAARLLFTDRLSVRRDKTVFAMPLALGVKYRCNDTLALRLECTDNIAFGSNSSMGVSHNFSLTGGVEVRFGGTRKSYWPWNPSRHQW